MVNLRKRLKDYPSIISWEEEIICTFSYFHLLQGINFNSPMRKCCSFLGQKEDFAIQIVGTEWWKCRMHAHIVLFAEDRPPVRNWEHCCSVGKAVPVMAVDTGSCGQHTLYIFSHCLTPFPLMPFNIQFIRWTPLVQIAYISDCCLIRIWLCMEDIFRKGMSWSFWHLGSNYTTNCRLLLWYFGFMHWTCEFVCWSPPREMGPVLCA